MSKVNSELYFDLKTGKVKEKIQATSFLKSSFDHLKITMRVFLVQKHTLSFCRTHQLKPPD